MARASLAGAPEQTWIQACHAFDLFPPPSRPSGLLALGACTQNAGTLDSPSSVRGGAAISDVLRFGDRVKVNRHLWTASLQILDFLPLQTADPFTGVISTGWGRPAGGGQEYRATVVLSDPALDARSLHVAMQTRSGPVSAETLRQIEDAIFTRARQLRFGDTKL